MTDKTHDDYIFFWSGIYSNWFPSNITLEGMTFNCVEQYMMYKKALEFGDTETAKKVMEAEEPREQKKLGRQVEGFDAEHWSKVRFERVIPAMREKFRSHPVLKRELLNSGDKTIVEASPLDDQWGIGMGADDPEILDESKWGLNVLGKMIMQVRDELREESETV